MQGLHPIFRIVAEPRSRNTVLADAFQNESDWLKRSGRGGG